MPWTAAHRLHFCTPLISELSKLEISSLLITAVSWVLSCHLLFNTFLRQIVYKWLSFFAWHHYIIPFTYHMQRRSTMAVGGPPRATLSFFFFEVCNTPIPPFFSLKGEQHLWCRSGNRKETQSSPPGSTSSNYATVHMHTATLGALPPIACPAFSAE